MDLICAGCGCVVDRGVIVTQCEDYPSCCCEELLRGVVELELGEPGETVRRPEDHG